MMKSVLRRRPAGYGRPGSASELLCTAVSAIAELPRGGGRQLLLYLGQRRAAVYARFSRAEQVQVRAVQ